MRILFDQGTPVPLRSFLKPHQVLTAYELGWSNWKNGELLAAAEAHGFEVFVSTDQNLRYQQNLGARGIGLVILTSTSWPRMKLNIEKIVSAIQSLPRRGYIEVFIEP